MAQGWARPHRSQGVHRSTCHWSRIWGTKDLPSSICTFYGTDATRSLLLLSDGAYLEDQARVQNLGGDQWGMMDETGSYPASP